MTPTLTYFNLPRLRMHAAVAGPEDGPLVVLLHGFPQFWHSWRKIIPPLAAAGYRVIAPDQRGYNLTDKTGPYDVRTLAQDIADLIAANGRDHAHVAGHDWGAVVAWSLAAAHPARVARLAILNVPHPAVALQMWRHPRQILRSYYIGVFQAPRLPEWALQRRDFAALCQAMATSARPGTFARADFGPYKEAWGQPGALSAMLGWYRALATHTRTFRSVGRRIAAPTVILWGERDHALEASLGRESAAWLDDGRLIAYPDVTHWIVDEIPEEVTRQLLTHFAGG